MNSIPLSTQADRFLKSLARLPMPLTEHVEKALIAQGVPTFTPWLNFHERFAGYVEHIARERVVWGLMHYKPAWLRPQQVAVSRDSRDGRHYIICADIHPSYQYELDQDGEFDGGPSKSFEVYVEQQALRWWFCTQIGPPPKEQQFHIKDPHIIERIESETRIAEKASDEFTRYFLGESLLAVQEVDTRDWVEVLSR